MTERLGIVTFWWGTSFTAEHVNRLRAGFRRHCFLPHDFYCVTNDPRGLDEFVKVVPQWSDFTDMRRNFRRLRLLAADVNSVIPNKRILMSDLDQVITGDLTPVLERKEPVVVWKCPAHNGHGYAYNPSFLLMDAGCKSSIWEAFKRDPQGEIKRADANSWTGTDQLVISNWFDGDPDIATVDAKDGFLSWRDHFDKRGVYDLPDRARLVSFYGDFDPSNAESQRRAPWITQHWRSLRMDLLDSLIEQNGWTSGAELGVFDGRTFMYLLHRNPALHLLGVDTWTHGDGPCRRNDGYRSYANYPLGEYYRILSEAVAGIGPRAELMRTTTVEAAAKVPDASLDFVFVDADHTEAAVRADIQAWRPKIRAGGMLLGHDLHFPGVHATVADLLPGWRSWPDYCWSVRV